MEFLPVIFELSRYYAFFCLVTTFCFVVLNMCYIWQIKPDFGTTGRIVYLAVIAVTTFIFAPVFFIVLIFYPEVYKAAVYANLSKQDDDE